MSELNDLYESIRPQIEQKYETFQTVWGLGDAEIFPELVFCLCTPQTNAKHGWKAAQALIESGLLYEPINGVIEEQQRLIQVGEILSKAGVRFKKNKAKYIVQAIQRFNNGNAFKIFLTNLIKKSNNMRDVRNWLAENVYGMGMKEASHFLRNVGQGDEVCILDRHILRNLVENGVIEKIPQHLNKKTYLEIETEMIKFSKEVDIPLFALDFVFWYNAKGELFK